MIHIKEPYYSAGHKFEWPYKPIGLGIALKHLKGTVKLTVGDSPKVWVAPADKLLTTAAQYNAYHTARGTKLAVVPWELFTEEKAPSPQGKLL